MFVIGFPRSGNTWLCYLLAYCLNSGYDDFDDPGIHPRDARTRNYVKGGLSHTSYEPTLGKILKTHCLDHSLLNGEKFIYAVRDARDVMLSYYHYRRSFISAQKQAETEDDREQSELTEFIKMNLPLWVTHVQDAIAFHGCLTVKYEDLNRDTEVVLMQTFERLSVTVDEKVIQQAVKMFSFSSMSGREKGTEDNRSFYRSGIVNGWEKHLSAHQLDLICAGAGNIMRELGYKI